MLAGLRRADRDGGARFAPEHSSNIDARLRYDSSPVVDVFVIAKVAATCGLRTVRVGKPRGTRNGGLSAWNAAMRCNLTALCRGRRHSDRAKDKFSGGRHFFEHSHPSPEFTRPSAPEKCPRRHSA